jgi:hypothetical protein
MRKPRPVILMQSNCKKFRRMKPIVTPCGLVVLLKRAVAQLRNCFLSSVYKGEMRHIVI